MSWLDYRANPLLMIPPLAAFCIGVLASMVDSVILSLHPLGDFSVATLGPYFSLIAVLQSIVSFFVILGQLGMTEKVIADGGASLRDWASAVKHHFIRVLWISLPFAALGVMIFILFNWAFAYLIEVRLLWAHQSTLDLMRRMEFAQLISNSLTSLLEAFVLWFWNLCLASTVLERRSFRASLGASKNVVRGNRGLFVRLVLFYWTVSLLLTVVSAGPFLLGIMTQPKIGITDASSMVSNVIGSLLSPLWYLIGFVFYVEATGYGKIDRSAVSGMIDGS